MSMFNLIGYSDISSKIYGTVLDFLVVDNNSVSFKLKEKTALQTSGDCTENVETLVPLKYLTNFWDLLKCH